MKTSVVFGLNQLKIGSPIIKFIPVDMMNLISLWHGMEKKPMHHEFNRGISLRMFFPLKTLDSFIIFLVYEYDFAIR